MDVEMTVQVRTETGKGAARRLRRGDVVPAILYGPKTAPDAARSAGNTAFETPAGNGRRE